MDTSHICRLMEKYNCIKCMQFASSFYMKPADYGLIFLVLWKILVCILGAYILRKQWLVEMTGGTTVVGQLVEHHSNSLHSILTFWSWCASLHVLCVTSGFPRVLVFPFAFQRYSGRSVIWLLNFPLCISRW